MQLVLHAPFGSRINKAWALALRKRFCRQFNFELQAAATEDALMLSLGPQHSFPLSDVFRYLHPETTRDVLVQAFLDAPVFETRWRWNATVSLAVPRRRGSRKVAPQLQRMLAADLLASVFPDAAACLENIPGDREIPDHPLVNQTVRDCLEEAMDFDGTQRVLDRIHRGELRLVARDTPEPSVFAYEILDARPYAFLDDAPLEERRSHAVQTRRGTDAPDDLGTLDAAAIARVRDEARPDPRDADELHDTLMTAGFRDAELDQGRTIPRTLAGDRRACRAGAPRIDPRRPSSPPSGCPSCWRPPGARSTRRSRRRRHARVRGRASGRRRAAARTADPHRPHDGERSVAVAADRDEGCGRRAPRARSGGRRPSRAVQPRLHPRQRMPQAIAPSNGATARCSRASTATRCIVCAPRSSRSARQTSCAFCSSGSTSIPPIG